VSLQVDMFGNRRKRAASNPVSSDDSSLRVAQCATHARGKSLGSTIRDRISERKHLLTCISTGPQCIQYGPFCSQRSCPSLPEEPGLERFAFLGRCGCSSQGSADDSNLRGRCADKEDTPEDWLDFVRGKFYWISKRATRIPAGTQVELRLYVRADFPGLFTCSSTTCPQRC
jgi:hypothetical protein